MKRISCLLTCLVLLTFNLIDAFQHVKPETVRIRRFIKRNNYGQQYSNYEEEQQQQQPSYSMRFYSNQQRQLQRQQQQQPARIHQYNNILDRLESFDDPYDPTSIQLASSLLTRNNLNYINNNNNDNPLNSNNIFLNGQEDNQFLNKYKNFNKPNYQVRQQQQLNRFPTTKDDDFNKLLVSIENIQKHPSSRSPSSSLNEEKYIGNFQHKSQSKQQQQKPERLQHPAVVSSYKSSPAAVAVADADDDTFLLNDNDFINGNTNTNINNLNQNTRINLKIKQHPAVFSEENMAIPYDEIATQEEEQQQQQQQKPEPIINKKNNDDNTETKIQHQFAPSSMLQDQHMVRSIKAYHKPMNNNFSSLDTKISTLSDIYFIAIVVCVSTVAIFSVIGAGYCFYKVQQSNKAAADVEFPAYGVIGPASRNDATLSPKCTSPSNDHKLVQSAQIYHYHHQKQQMISTEKNSNVPKNNNNNGSDIESDEENEDGEYTVYECPGLAPAGEMEIKNPLFQDDLTPMSSPSINGSAGSKTTTPKSNEANGKTE